MLPKVSRAARGAGARPAADPDRGDDRPRRARVGIEAQIETARGLINVEEICAASDRLETIIFGPADFAASTEMPVLTGGVQIPEYPGDHFHYVFSKILMAGRANGLQVIDGPFLKIRELDALRDYAMRTAHPRLRRQVGAAPRPGQGHQRGLHADPGAVRPGLRHPRRLREGHDRGRPQGRGDVRRRDDRRGQPQDGEQVRHAAASAPGCAAARADRPVGAWRRRRGPAVPWSAPSVREPRMGISRLGHRSRDPGGVPRHWETSQSVAGDLHRRMHSPSTGRARTLADARRCGVPTDHFESLLRRARSAAQIMDEQLPGRVAPAAADPPPDAARPALPHRRSRADRRSHRPHRPRRGSARRRRVRGDAAPYQRAPRPPRRGSPTSCASSVPTVRLGAGRGLCAPALSDQRAAESSRPSLGAPVCPSATTRLRSRRATGVTV